jgi:hypothetical protein
VRERFRESSYTKQTVQELEKLFLSSVKKKV